MERVGEQCGTRRSDSFGQPLARSGQRDRSGASVISCSSGHEAGVGESVNEPDSARVRQSKNLAEPVDGRTVEELV